MNVDDAVNFIMSALPDVLVEIAIDVLSLECNNNNNSSSTTECNNVVAAADNDDKLTHKFEVLTQAMNDYAPELNSYLESTPEMGVVMRGDAADRQLKEAEPLYYEPEGTNVYETPGYSTPTYVVIDDSVDYDSAENDCDSAHSDYGPYASIDISEDDEYAYASVTVNMDADENAYDRADSMYCDVTECETSSGPTYWRASASIGSDDEENVYASPYPVHAGNHNLPFLGF